jgi:hypothetical protein
MANLLIQTATDEMLARSIVNSVRLQEIGEFLSRDSQDRLARTYPDGECWVWGLTPGEANQRYWERLELGDEAVFFAGGSIRFYLQITYKEQNRELAEHIWGIRRHHRHGDDKIFELLYFSTKPEIVDISLDRFNELTGDHFRRMPQNAYIIGQKKADHIRDELSAQLRGLPTILKTAPNADRVLTDIIAPVDAPPLRTYVPRAFEAWQTDGKRSDPFTMLKNHERRTQAHQDLLNDVWAKRPNALVAEESDLIDLLIDSHVFIEIKSISRDELRQVRAALAQLYHYRFVYRRKHPNPDLLAIFGERPVHQGEDLTEFLTSCGIASAWQTDLRSFDGTAEAKRLVPWLTG